MVQGTFTRRSTLSALAGAIGGGVVVGGAGGGKQDECGDEGASAKQTDASITFEDQYTDGSSLVVQKVVLPEAGFIDFHDPTRAGGVFPPLGAALGVSEYLESGTHENIEIPLFQDVKCVNFAQERLFETQHVMTMPHVDSNGNQEFDHWCTMGSEAETLDGGFGDFPNLVMDMAYVAVRQGGQEVETGGHLNETEDGGMNETGNGN